MALYEVEMPKLGESIVEATIIRWLKQPGDKVEVDEPILEIATDKVDSEVPAPVSGVLKEVKYKEGDVVPVGNIIAVIEMEGEAASEAPQQPEPATEAVTSEPPATNGQPEPEPQPVTTTPSLEQYLLEKPAQGRFYSPLVLNIARKEGIPMELLDRIPGTGRGGRVTKKDILQFLKIYKAQPEVVTTIPQQAPSPEPQVEKTPVAEPEPTIQKTPVVETTTQKTTATAAPHIVQTRSVDGEVEIIEMSRMRKIIAENMIKSKHTSAHVTSFVEADVTPVVQWREKVKDAFFKKYGVKLTYTHIFVEVLAKVLREMPMLNASVEGDKIIIKKYINIGIAVALPDDNLIVPVIKNADMLSLAGIAKIATDLTERARKGQLKPDEITDGTYTLSNVGTFGNVMGTPIILQPQVAILATGAIRKKPAVIETPQGDFIGIRHMMFLSHTYDHRIIDGALGGRFVRRVADLLESWDINREI